MPSVAIIGTRGYPSYYGGFETAVRRIAPHLSQSGWDVTVYGRPGATTSREPDAVRNIETWGIERKSLSTLTYGLSSSLHSARKKPDIALVMNVANGFWLPILRSRRIPTVVNVDGIEWERAKWGRLAKQTFRTGAAMTARYATHLIFDAKEIGRRWKSEFGRDGSYIPYGGDPLPETLTLEPGLEHRKYALMVARFVPENSVHEFLDAATAVSRDFDVVLVGSSGYGGPLDDRAASLTRGNPRIKWMGHISDDRRLHALWQHAGAYFHGHSVGGTNPALVQAMACGAPIIARDTAFNREVLSEEGIFVSADPTAIAESVLELLRDPVAQEVESQRSLAQASAHFTWPAVVSSYEELLRSHVK